MAVRAEGGSRWLFVSFEFFSLLKLLFSPDFLCKSLLWFLLGGDHILHNFLCHFPVFNIRLNLQTLHSEFTNHIGKRIPPSKVISKTNFITHYWLLDVGGTMLQSRCLEKGWTSEILDEKWKYTQSAGTLTRSGNLNRGKLKPCTTVSCLRYCSGLKPNVTSNGFMRVVFRSNKDKRVQVAKVKVVQVALY